MGTSLNISEASPEAVRIVSELVAKARAAQRIYEGYDQAQVDEVVTALGWVVMAPENNRMLAALAVDTTTIGNVEDKIIKNHRKTLGLLRDLKGARSVGVIAEYPDKGLVEIGRPVGVVGAVVPSTNPIATPINKTLNALKCRDAIIIAPSPKGQRAGGLLVTQLRAALKRIGAPEDLVQVLPDPISKDTTYELMRQVDLVVVTGSQNNVRAAYTCGTPAIGVGAGNAPSIVDETADVEAAGAKIAASKTFDNATSCSSENSVVLVDAIYDRAIQALEKAGGALLDADEKDRLRSAMWVEGSLQAQVTAKSAGHIARVAGLTRPQALGARFLMVEETRTDRDCLFAGEKLSPVLTVYRARDFDHACQLVNEILETKGKGHSVSIHSRDDARILRLGNEIPVCRVIVNQAHCFATGGSFDNGLPFSLSMGCGTWGGNGIHENMNYRHYMNVTRIARTIPANEPALDEIFGSYWAKYGQDLA